MIKKFLKQNWPYLALLIITIALHEFRVYNPEGPIGSHLSNAVISGELLLLLTGPGEFRKFSNLFKIVACVLITINVLLELGPAIGDIGSKSISFIDFNTPDPLDMVFGVGYVSLLLLASYYVRSRRNNLGK